MVHTDFVIKNDLNDPGAFYKKALIFEVQNKFLLAIFQVSIAIQKFIEQEDNIETILDFEEINSLYLSDL